MDTLSLTTKNSFFGRLVEVVTKFLGSTAAFVGAVGIVIV